ncbi:MAG: hypothetical protein ACLQBC_10860 [Syntrophales bacterium]
MTIINFGKHHGKSCELVLLKDPHYVKWVLETNVEGPLKQVQIKLVRLVQIFNAKPFITKCRVCSRPAERATLYKDNAVILYWWCNDCHIYGNRTGVLSEVSTYESALRYVASVCKKRKSDYQILIKELAQAKGLAKRVGQVQAVEFFGMAVKAI